MSTSSEGYSEGLSNHELASQVISKYTGKSTAGNNKRKTQPVVKDDDEYHKKRARNNVAVKKSREKAKNRIQDTQSRVEQLSKENEELQTKVNLLSKELNVLRALFTNGGFTLPGELQYSNGTSSSSEHGPPSMTYSPHSRMPPSEEPASVPKTSPLHSTHSTYDSEKPIYHPIDDPKTMSKIPPLRPMPRIPSTTSSGHKMSHHSSFSSNFNAERLYSLPKPDYPTSTTQKDSKSTGPPLLIQPGPQSVANNYPQFKGDTRHPSVIRSTTEITTPSTTNMLGKFCIIKDPQDNGQIKVVPMNS